MLGILNEVIAVRQALLELRHSVTCIALALPLEAAREKLCRLEVDLVFNLFEGFCADLAPGGLKLAHPCHQPKVESLLLGQCFEGILEFDLLDEVLPGDLLHLYGNGRH